MEEQIATGTRVTSIAPSSAPVALFEQPAAGGTATRVPLTILTGFLGAGKTTLLNRILNGDHGLRIAVLVNDFGSINIDADLVVGVESNVISLTNGCVCCTIRDDLLQTVLETLDRPEKPEYVLLEASGVAEPSGIALTFAGELLSERIRLDSITCVVDAEQVFAYPELMELKIRQMAFADMIVLNKVDLIDRAQIDRIRAWLDSRFHRYRLVEAKHADVPLEVLLSAGRFESARPELQDCHRAEGVSSQSFSTWSYETDQRLSLAALSDSARRLPAGVYRAKGVVYTSEAPERRAVLQVVGKRVDISLLDEWGTRPRRTRIVAIGAEDALDPDELRRLLDACVEEPISAS